MKKLLVSAFLIGIFIVNGASSCGSQSDPSPQKDLSYGLVGERWELQQLIIDAYNKGVREDKVTLNDVQVLAHSRFSVFVDYMKTTSVYQIIEKSPKRDGNPVASFTVDSYNTIVSPKNEQIPGHGHAPSHGHGHGHGDDSNAGGGIIIAD